MHINKHVRIWYEQWVYIDRLYSKFASKYSLTLSSFEVLSEIYYNSNDFSQKELASKLGFAKQTLSNVMKGLESRGWVERKESNQDKRLVVFKLTDVGSSFCKKIFKELEQVEYNAFKSLSDDERETFTKVNVELTKLIEEGMSRGGKDGN